MVSFNGLQLVLLKNADARAGKCFTYTGREITPDPVFHGQQLAKKFFKSIIKALKKQCIHVLIHCIHGIIWSTDLDGMQ